MKDLSLPEFDGYRTLVNQELSNGTDPERLRYLAIADDEEANLDQRRGMLTFARPHNADGAVYPRITVEERFLSDVATHLCDRMTKWEEYNFQRHAVYSSAAPVTMIQADPIPGLYKAVKSSGIFPFPITRQLPAPTSVRWIAIPDDDPTQPPHVLRVAANGYRGTMNLMTVKFKYPHFGAVALPGDITSVFHLWSVATAKPD